MPISTIPAHRLSFGDKVFVPGPNHLNRLSCSEWGNHRHYRAVVIDRKLLTSTIQVTLVYEGRFTNEVTSIAPNARLRTF